MARRNIAEILSGAVVLIAAAGFLAYAVAHSGRSAAGGYMLEARFDRIDGLAVGTDVRMAGVKIGAVTSTRIDPQTYLAEVSFTVQNDIAVPKDSSAEINSDGLLGGKFLSLVPGADTVNLQPGQRVTITQSSVSLEQLLGKFIFSTTEAKGGQGQTPPPTSPLAPAPPR
jgi:phospholipid/cholesterol/gamma-HCH transport system substrate-binding protein